MESGGVLDFGPFSSGFRLEGVLGGLMGPLRGGSGGLLGPKTLQESIFGPNLATTWSQLGPSLLEIGPNLASTWLQLSSILDPTWP